MLRVLSDHTDLGMDVVQRSRAAEHVTLAPHEEFVGLRFEAVKR